MQYKLLVLILLFVGTVLVTTSLVKASIKCPKHKVIYRFVPRSFKDELETPVDVTAIFRDMFEKPSPWLGAIQNYDKRKQEDINKFFVAQA